MFLRVRAFLPSHFPPKIPRARPNRLLCTQTLSKAQPGNLYIVSTPIGNVSDLTPRAASILSTASIIAAEDTRVAGLLLQASNLRRPPDQHLLSCHEHNWRDRLPGLLSSLQDGKSVALISDAGTPCISDPGFQLVAAAAAADLRIVPVPGACAALAAIVASAVPSSEFSFFGFLPRPGSKRTRALDKLQQFDGTVVLYESPHRLLATLQALTEGPNGKRKICLAREVTKRYEEFLRFGTVDEANEWFQTVNIEPRGEFTLVLGPLPVVKVNRDDLRSYSGANIDVVALTEAMIRDGVPVSSVARYVTAAADIPKKLVYKYASQFKQALEKEVEQPSVT